MFLHHLPNIRKYSTAGCAALLMNVVSVSAEPDATTPMTANDSFVIAQGDPKGPLKAADPEMLLKKIKGKSGMRVQGVKVQRMRGKKAGKGKGSMPGAKFVSRTEVARMTKASKTGLFIIDAEFVPAGLADDLKERGYNLKKDGTLTKDGEPVTLFVEPETYLVTPEKDVRKGKGGGGGALLRINPLKEPVRFASEAAGLVGNAAADLGAAVESVFVSKAHAASPFPWRCSSWYRAYRYWNLSLNLRTYVAWTRAYAYGADSNGYCGSYKPYTRIQYIHTYVKIDQFSDSDYRFNSETVNSATFHPAVTSFPPYGVHFAYWRDGSRWLFRKWTWGSP